MPMVLKRIENGYCGHRVTFADDSIPGVDLIYPNLGFMA